MFSKQFTKAEEAYNKGLQLNATELSFYLNLAHVYMFTDRLSEAKVIHKKYGNESVSSKTTWKQQVENDFKLFESKDLPTENFKKILRVLD